jgi:hypothetical protein
MANTIRVHKRENRFIDIPKTMVNDDDLSMRSLGILAYIYSKGEGWQVDKNDILARFANPLINSALTEQDLDICLQEILESGYFE